MHPGELRSADLHDVAVQHADVGARVPLPPGRPGHPDLVVHLAVRIHARLLVAVAVADEDVLDARFPQQVDVGADVRGVQRHAQRAEVEVHEVDAGRHADDRQPGVGELLERVSGAQQNHRATAGRLHRREPHVGLVDVLGRAGEVERDLGPFPGHPVVHGGQHARLAAPAAQRGQRQHRGGEQAGGERHQAGDHHRGDLVARGGHHRRRHQKHVEQRHVQPGQPPRPGRRHRDAPQRAEVDVAGVRRGVDPPVDHLRHRVRGYRNGPERGGQQQHRDRAGHAGAGRDDHQQDHRQVPHQLPEGLAEPGLVEQFGGRSVPPGQGQFTGEGDHGGHRERHHQAEYSGEDHDRVAEERRAHRGETLLAANSAQQRHAPCLPRRRPGSIRTAATLNGSHDTSIAGVSGR